MISSSHVEPRHDQQDGDSTNQRPESRGDPASREFAPASRESGPTLQESATSSRESINCTWEFTGPSRESPPLKQSPENLSVQSTSGPTDLSVQPLTVPIHLSAPAQVSPENLSIQPPIGPRNLQVSIDPRTTSSPWTEPHSYAWWQNRERASPPRITLTPQRDRSPLTRTTPPHPTIHKRISPPYRTSPTHITKRDRTSPTHITRCDRASPTHITQRERTSPTHITQTFHRTSSPQIATPASHRSSPPRNIPPTVWRDDLERPPLPGIRLPPENTHKAQGSPPGPPQRRPQTSASSLISAESVTGKSPADLSTQEHYRSSSFSGLKPSIHISPVPFDSKSPVDYHRETQLQREPPYLETEALLRERYLSRRDSGPWQSFYPRERRPLPAERFPLSSERLAIPSESLTLPGERLPYPVERLPSHRERISLPAERFSLPENQFRERHPHPRVRNPLSEPISPAEELRSRLYTAAYLQSLPYQSPSHPLIFPPMTSGLLPRSSFGLFRPGMPAFPRPAFHPSNWPVPPSSLAEESYSPMEKKKEEPSSRRRKTSPDRSRQSPDESRPKSRSPPQPQPPKGSELIVRDGKDVRDHSLKHRILTRSPKSPRPPPASLMEEPWKGASPRSGSQSSPSPYYRAATLTAASGITGGKPISSTRPYLPPPRVTHSIASEGGMTADEGGVAVGQPGYPAHFTRGSLIQLANGEMKQVENLVTEDFIRSAEFSPDVRIDHSTVVKLEPVPATGSVLLSFSVGKQRIQVTVEAALEHPFFVFGQGWSSSNPELTEARYRLNCNQLKVGDVCISLTHKANAASPPSLLLPSTSSITDTRRSSSSSIVSSNRSSSSTPSKQVVFHDTPSIIRIDPESPPISRIDSEDTGMLTTISPPLSTPSPVDKKSRNVSVLVSVTTSTATPVSSPSHTSPSQDSIDLKRHWSGDGESGHNHKPKKIKTGDNDV